MTDQRFSSRALRRPAKRMSGLVWVFLVSACCSSVVAINTGGDVLSEHLIVYLQVFIICAAIGSAIWAGSRVLFWLIKLPAQVQRHYLRRQAERRWRLGLCLYCGYDLRAAKDRCPECGAEMETWVFTTPGQRDTVPS